MIICKGCGAGMRFEPATQKLKCDYCGALSDIIRQDADITAEEKPEYDSNLFTCPQCGAELYSDDDTAATFCSFCGSSVIIESRHVKMKAPSTVLPFMKAKEECADIYKSFINKAIYAPRYMKEGHTEKLRGIYMPYWVYDFSHDSQVSFPGYKSYRSGDYMVTDNYGLSTKVIADYRGVSFDASSSFADELSEAIAPFYYTMGKPFTPAYISGFYADAADVEASVYERTAKETVAADIGVTLQKEKIFSTFNASISPEDNRLVSGLDTKKKEMAYFPVWFLANRHKGYVSYAVINGQTGKVAADIPIDYTKYILGSLILALPIAFILNLAFTLRPMVLAIIAIIFAGISYFISDKQLNLLFTRTYHLDDIGLQSKWKKQNNGVTPQVQTKAAKKKPKSVNNLSEIGKYMCSGAFMLFYIAYDVNIDVVAPFALLLFISGIALLLIGNSKIIRKRDALKKNVMYKQPFSEKKSVLLKPLIAIVLAIILLIVNPFIDMIYYGCIVVIMALVLYTFKDIVAVHNKLTKRLPRQFAKRGGDENEITE